MKSLIIPLSLALAIVTISLGLKKENSSLEIGATAPLQNYAMASTSGKDVSLKDLKKEKGLLVIFSCNTCPFVVGGNGFGKGWQTRYNDLQKSCDQNGIGMVLVNSNEAKRGGDDSMQKMKAHAKKEGYLSEYVVDGNSKLANAFGAKTTPHVFLFDKDLKLVYKGAIDDDNTGKNVGETYLMDALQNLSEGLAIEPTSTRNKGCSIKRVH